jgi:hypothetical protein
MEKELILDQMVRKDRENGMREKELSGLIERFINFEKKLFIFIFFSGIDCFKKKCFFF